MSRFFYFDDRVFAAVLALAVWTALWGLMDYDLRHPPTGVYASVQKQR